METGGAAAALVAAAWTSSATISRGPDPRSGRVPPALSTAARWGEIRAGTARPRQPAGERGAAAAAPVHMRRLRRRRHRRRVSPAKQPGRSSADRHEIAYLRGTRRDSAPCASISTTALSYRPRAACRPWHRSPSFYFQDTSFPVSWAHSGGLTSLSNRCVDRESDRSAKRF